MSLLLKHNCIYLEMINKIRTHKLCTSIFLPFGVISAISGGSTVSLNSVKLYWLLLDKILLVTTAEVKEVEVDKNSTTNTAGIIWESSMKGCPEWRDKVTITLSLSLPNCSLNCKHKINSCLPWMYIYCHNHVQYLKFNLCDVLSNIFINISQ